MSGAEHDPVLVAARRALLDVLGALERHRDNVIVIGAQAVYLHTGALDLPLAETTKDADVALDGRQLDEDPRVEQALTDAGFYPDPDKHQPGAWCSPDGLPVDVMVPERFAGPAAKNRRGARIPPHHKSSMRRAEGLEAAVVDNQLHEITALDDDDHRRLEVKVAGPAARLVAKLFKLHERSDQPHRLEAKDAHDTHRLGFLEELFGHADATGSQLAGEAERGVGEPEVVAQAASLLTADLLGALNR